MEKDKKKKRQPKRKTKIKKLKPELETMIDDLRVNVLPKDYYKYGN